jgi:hypothetical protein
MLMLIGLVWLLIFALLGYRRGILRWMISLAALLVAGLVAQPLGSIGAVFVKGALPKLLQPLGGSLVVGLVVFALLDWVLGRPLKRREARREEEGLPKLEAWEKLAGSGFGFFWGLGLMLLIMVGISAAGSSQRAMRQVDQELQQRQEKPEGWQQLKVIPYQEEGLEKWAGAIEQSPFGATVAYLNPVNEKVQKTLTDLAVVTNDRRLFALFCAQPAVIALRDEPKLQELAQDAEVAQLVRSANYRALMDHPKVLAMAQDPEMVKKFRNFPIDEVLKEIRRSSAQSGGFRDSSE